MLKDISGTGQFIQWISIISGAMIGLWACGLPGKAILTQIPSNSAAFHGGESLENLCSMGIFIGNNIAKQCIMVNIPNLVILVNLNS